jgi:hypothetical protein
MIRPRQWLTLISADFDISAHLNRREQSEIETELILVRE